MVHRGPDEEGFFTKAGVGLGARRLSIIDIEHGQQPISSEDGSMHVVSNGEIYNYRQLGSALRKQGHVFRTSSDTEVIVHLYEEKGKECFQDLRGMFGTAIWDESRRRLVLARDRLGKKPLFYCHRDDRLIFASEIKAILAAAPELAEIDEEALMFYFKFGFVCEPSTIFKQIRKLPAGHLLTYQSGQAELIQYWKLPWPTGSDSEDSPHIWIDRLDELLQDSVRLRLKSDVPLGIFLSGGLDSSSIVHYAHETDLHPLKTFTIGFDHPDWDESKDAQRIADHFQTQHHLLNLPETDMLRDLPETMSTLARHFDEPFGDSSALPTYFISRLARQHVTVILGGDGGDELFAGYDSYKGFQFAEIYRLLPSFFGARLAPEAMQFAARLLPSDHHYSALRLAKVLRQSGLQLEDLYFEKMAAVEEETLVRVLSPDFFGALRSSIPKHYPPDVLSVLRLEAPLVNRIGYADIRFRLLNDMLVKVDRMSMASSLEVRSPFLDHKLVEFSTLLASDLKFRRWQGKRLLRSTLESALPPENLAKPKKGFSVPLREWFRTGLRDLLEDYLNGGADDGVLDKERDSSPFERSQKGETGPQCSHLDSADVRRLARADHDTATEVKEVRLRYATRCRQTVQRCVEWYLVTFACIWCLSLPWITSFWLPNCQRTLEDRFGEKLHPNSWPPLPQLGWPAVGLWSREAWEGCIPGRMRGEHPHRL